MKMTQLRMHGLTLIELLVTLAVAVTLALLAAPLFNSFTSGNASKSADNLLARQLLMARSEAIKRGIPVSLCPSSDGATCTGGTDWSVGWIAFTDAGTVGSKDGGDVIVLVQDNNRTETTVACDQAYLRWFSDGIPDSNASPNSCPIAP